ncbi:MAG: hypothetical protein E5V92_01960 [Mesorhizobium sp.]|uniref:hypothetical protein n=1 Tax=unclassified Mesorhizobium TaxID=325217 RepID=UPI000F75979C|nr:MULTISPECIES: hypothetical protein [unclassified Mesorhizobium]AZO75020.1 hypothetical protein EJ067_30500 [Mesorhizobium sp. M1D.F.Ca.ET.043.01.1.1]RWA96109.1 MAG: hypothetical protein EOQ32_00375 [Mesorhizobium sp.]TIV71446.1 MAG: hypothetical protein E5V89_10085 [Mesorhizobium sp.]TJW90389.1 MAG: hypothetical protein E5V92_01960 [Mesorhizobium sp.]
MSREPWDPKMTYTEGERVRFCGEVYEAKFDLVRGTKPYGPLSEKFWRRVPTVRPSKANDGFTGRKLTNGYLTRSMSHG